MTILWLNATVGQYDDATRTVPILASTPNAPGDGQPAITEWDLERYTKNPIVLWAHDQKGDRLPIGTATSLTVDEAGLKAVVRLASEKANPLAENVWQLIREQVQRAVSVGYDLIGEHAARLVEISFVPVGLDEDAGTVELNPEAANQRSAAAREAELLKRFTSDASDEECDALLTMFKSLPKRAEIPAPTASEEDDETIRKKIAAAASMMSKHRARLARKRAEEAAKAATETLVKRYKEEVERKDSVDRFDMSELRVDANLDRFEKTQAGGRVIPARLSRIGVLRYVNPDGTIRRELRLPEEVFKADSMKTLEHASVVDIANHRSLVDTASYQRKALGTTTNVRREGKYLVGDLRVDDANALDAIERDERKDTSCGYRCRLDWTSGVYEGEPYDCIQRDITYNHVALCPPNRGRAGTDVGLRLDAGDDESNIKSSVARIDDAEERGTTMPGPNDNVLVKIRFDGKEVTEFSPEHFALVNNALEKFRADATDLQTKLDAATVRADRAEGERDGLKTEIETLRADAKEEKSKQEEKQKDKEKAERAFVRARRKLERMTIRFFGGPDDEEEDDEEEEKSKKSKREFPPKEEKGKRGFPQSVKDELGVEDEEEGKKGKRSTRSDSTDDDKLTDERLDSMSDRELMLWGIKRVDPRFDSKDEEGKERSDDYIRARFDAACATAKANRSIHGVVRGHESFRSSGAADRFDADDLDRQVAKARAERDKNALEAGRK